MKCKIDTALARITWTADTGETVTLDMTKCHPSIVGVGPTYGYAAYHGMKQRCADTAAIERDKETGASVTDKDRLGNIQTLVDHYASGTDQWSRTRGAPKRELTREEKLALYAKLKAELGVDAGEV